MLFKFFLTFLFAMLGASLVSFADSVAVRTVIGEKWWGFERSVCDGCRKKLSVIELIPVFSYIFQKGRSRCCNYPLSKRYFLLEAAGGVFSAFLPFLFDFYPVPIIFSLTALLFLTFFSVTDFLTGYIYDAFAYVMAGTGLFTHLCFGIEPFFDAVYGALFGFSVFFLIYILSRKKGMGYGDALLMLGLGSVLGFKMTVLSLYLTFFSALVLLLPAIITKKVGRKTAVPLAPYIELGTALAIIFSDCIFTIFSISAAWPWQI